MESRRGFTFLQSKKAKPALKFNNTGFTLIELILIMGLFAILAALATVNLLRPQNKASIDTAVTTLVADLKEQQIKAMAGDSEGQGTAFAYGVYFEPQKYTLFRGSSYSGPDPAYFVIDLGGKVTLSSTLPLSQVVFSRRSGGVANFVAGSNTITITQNSSGQQKTITINRFGVINVN